jgi:hypothetical protein
VLIGATPESRKELIGFTDGARESAQDWRKLLLDLKRCGLGVRPELAIADGALGFWKSVGKIWLTTRATMLGAHDRKRARQAAESAGEGQTRPCWRFGWPRRRLMPRPRSMPSSSDEVKYEKAVECLNKDRDALMTFYDFQLSTGGTCEPRTPSKAGSQPCATARASRRDACRTWIDQVRLEDGPAKEREFLIAQSRRIEKRILGVAPKFHRAQFRVLVGVPQDAVRDV